MSSVNVKPRPLVRRKFKSPAKLSETRATNSGSSKNPEPRSFRTETVSTTSHAVRSSSSNSATLGVRSPDVDDDDEGQELLLHVHSLLVQFWHRNKNQHRTQKWWKWVSVLKRGVRDLVELRRPGPVSGAVHAKNGEDELSEAALVRRGMERARVREAQRRQKEDWLREVVLARCWLAFSTLVADPQFSTLGVVLIAVLARVGKVVGLPRPALPAVAELKPREQPNTLLETSLTQMAVDRGEVVERGFDGRGAEHPGRAVKRKERVASATGTRRDRVESARVVSGRHLDDDKLVPGSVLPGGSGAIDLSLNTATTHHELADKVPVVAERKKTRRKKGNAIDELFAGLS